MESQITETTTNMGKRKRPELTTVGIKKDTHRKLQDYLFGLSQRPVMADVVSEAVEQWLAREGKENE